MRLKRIELSGFRGFAEAREINLDGNAVIVVGANGRGKTSLFDGILWALTGSIPRLGSDAKLISLYSSSGEARVVLELDTEEGDGLRVVRSYDGDRQRLLLEAKGEVLRDSAAGVQLLELVWPEALLTTDSAVALTTAITRSVYLQQDLVRDFIEADTAQSRFNVVSELLGSGRINEVQMSLERAKKAWSQATNVRAKDAEGLQERLRRMETQLSRLSHETKASEADLEASWHEWWALSEKLGVTVTQVPALSVEAPTAIDAAVKQVHLLIRSTEHRYDLVMQLMTDIHSRPVETLVDTYDPQELLERANQEISATRKALADAEILAAEERKKQTERRQNQEELMALAELALRHLGPQCPVCGQSHDLDTTRRRLEQIARVSEERAVESPSVKRVAELADVLNKQEKARVVAESDLSKAEEAIREQRRLLQDVGHRLKELGLDPDPGSAAIQPLQSLKRELLAVTDSLAAHRKQGEKIALELARVAESTRRAEIEGEAVKLRNEIEEMEKLLDDREETGNLSGRVLDGLRLSSSFFVERQLDQIEPLLKRIYTRIDPHPAFRDASFLARISYGRGHLNTAIKDGIANVSTESPGSVLSSSQMNAFGVAIFLAFNLGLPRLPLQTVILDDPLQSLDDVNLLGLIDLLRRTKARRQLLISTHDERFGNLLGRKLRPVDENERTLVIEFGDWTRDGPVVDSREVSREERQFRIAVSV